MDDVTKMIMATGALGTASFGLVDALKWTSWLGEAGFGSIRETLGEAATDALAVAYGGGWEAVLRAQYRQQSDPGKGELAKSLRQGIRVGLTPEIASRLASHFGHAESDKLAEIAKTVQEGRDPDDVQRNILARFELALDARVNAALVKAHSRYVGTARMAAGCIAVLAALPVGFVLGTEWYESLLIGFAAVPLAPIAKDLVSVIQAAQQALRARR